MSETEAGVCRADHLAEASHMRNPHPAALLLSDGRKHLKDGFFFTSPKFGTEGRPVQLERAHPELLWFALPSTVGSATRS